VTHQPPDPALAAKVLADSNARIAHHEAGHAVAAVARGGRLIGVWVNDIDWTVLPLDADIGKGGTATCTAAFEDQPFAYYAGPWAEAMWTCQNDPDVDDFDEALEYAWDDNTDGATAKYDERVAMLDGVAAQLGLGSAQGAGHAWEFGRGDELKTCGPQSKRSQRC